MSVSDFTPEHIKLAHSTYDSYVKLIDGQISRHPETPLEAQAFDSLPAHAISIPAARYNVLDFPTAETLTGPFTRALGQAAVLAFQTIERPNEEPVRKLELLNPFESWSLLLVLRATSPHPELPDLMVTGDLADQINRPPFHDAGLLHDLSAMARIITELSQSHRLVPITMADVQSMHRTPFELGAEPDS